jgi:PAS domain S-box-containing protein
MTVHQNGNGIIPGSEIKKEKGKHAKNAQADEGLLTLVKELERSQKQSEIVLEQAVDSVIVVNSAKMVTFVNNSAEKMFALNRQEILGQSAKSILPIELLDQKENYNERTSNGKADSGREVELVRKDGSKFWANLYL